MANIKKTKGIIGILTGGGDVPGLNPAIRGVTLRAHAQGYQVIGFKRGWAGLVEIKRDKKADNSQCYEFLTKERVERVGRSGGTFLHSSRTKPSRVLKEEVPEHLRDKYTQPRNDMTQEVIQNLDWLGVDYLIPIGGDDTLSYGVYLHQQGVKVIAIPKTMDNDVPGTDYCIGFSTCVSRTIELANDLRTSAGSHERFLVMEVFGRYAGFTAMLPTMAGVAHRCLIPEHKFNMEQLTELMVADRNDNPSRYSTVIVSEGAAPEGKGMIFENDKKDAYGHAKLGGIGDFVANQITELSPKYNKGVTIKTVNQKLAYLVRCGNPDAIDSIVPMAYGTIALNLITQGIHGRLVALRNGCYDDVPLETVTSTKSSVDVGQYYDVERLRPKYSNFTHQPMFIVTNRQV